MNSKRCPLRLDQQVLISLVSRKPCMIFNKHKYLQGQVVPRTFNMRRPEAAAVIFSLFLNFSTFRWNCKCLHVPDNCFFPSTFILLSFDFTTIILDPKSYIINKLESTQHFWTRIWTSRSEHFDESIEWSCLNFSALSALKTGLWHSLCPTFVRSVWTSQNLRCTLFSAGTKFDNLLGKCLTNFTPGGDEWTEPKLICSVTANSFEEKNL